MTPQKLAELAVSLAKQNERAEALALVDESIAARRPLHLPALFLAKGLVVLSGGSPESASAQECLEEAMLLAGQQSALSFELRAALALGQLWIDRGQIRRAHGLIAAVYDRFTEGFATPDLTLARRMLEQTSAPAQQAGRGAA